MSRISDWPIWKQNYKMTKYSKKMKIGMVVGKFAPLHLGHISMINQAAASVDHLYVVMSYDQRFVDGQSPWLKSILTRDNRLRWLKQSFSDIKHITVVSVDESDIPAYPNGWEQFVKLIDRQIGINRLDVTHIFGSETKDAENYEYYYPKAEYVCVDSARQDVSISATNIRQSVFDNWSMLPSVVRADFALKVAVVGPESTGKTTLVKYLAKYFATSWTEEYGRTFVENDLCGDETLLEPRHYPWIAMNHKIQEQEALRTCNRIMFSDTDAKTTALFMELYHDDYQVDEYQKHKPVVDAIAEWEYYDLVIVLSPTVDWVDDGMRRLGEQRRSVFDKLCSMYDLQSESVKVVDSESYHQRLMTAIDIVNQKMKSISGESE